MTPAEARRQVAQLVAEPEGRDALGELCGIQFRPRTAAEKARPRVTVWCQAYRGLHTRMKAATLAAMNKAAEVADVDEEIHVGLASLIHVGRNTCVSHALKDIPFTHFLFVDDDIVPGEDALVRLLGHDKGVCCGLYCTRSDRRELTAYTLGENGNFAPLSDWRGSGLREVEAAAAGFMLIKREVLEAVAEYWCDCGWEQSLYGFGGDGLEVMKRRRREAWERGKEGGWFRFLPLPSGSEVGEDIGFCLQARACGFPTYVDTDVVVGHVGDHVYLPR